MTRVMRRVDALLSQVGIDGRCRTQAHSSQYSVSVETRARASLLQYTGPQTTTIWVRAAVSIFL